MTILRDANTKGRVPTASVVNSTQTLLGADAEFTGEWEYNNLEHMACNVLASHDGTLFIEFAILKDGVDIEQTITDDDVIPTFSGTPAATLVYADQGRFRPLVKLPGRCCRVRYVNGSTPQTSFALLTVYGDNCFPASSSADNEVLTTVTERERDVIAAYSASNINTDTYAVLIDLSDTTNFPHDRTARIDLTNTFFNIDRS